MNYKIHEGVLKWFWHMERIGKSWLTKRNERSEYQEGNETMDLKRFIGIRTWTFKMVRYAWKNKTGLVQWNIMSMLKQNIRSINHGAVCEVWLWVAGAAFSIYMTAWQWMVQIKLLFIYFWHYLTNASEAIMEKENQHAEMNNGFQDPANFLNFSCCTMS